MRSAARILAGGALIFALGACTAASDVVLGTGPETGTGGRGAIASNSTGGAKGLAPGAGSGGDFMTFPSSTGGSIAACAPIVPIAERTSREILLLLDRSESMARPLPDPSAGTWWAAVCDASLRFYGDSLVSGDAMGVQTFPQLTPSSCDADYSVPVEAVARSSERQGSVLQTMSAAVLEERTPLAPALSGVLRYMALRTLSAGIAERHVVLVTDGLPDECDPRDVPGIADIARDAFEVDGVRTHVIGLNLGDAGPAFHAVAEAGGTGAAALIAGGDVADRLYAAMRDVLGAHECHWPVPEPPAGVTGSARDRITLTERRGSALPRVIPRLASSADCSLDAQPGWYLEPALDGGRPVARLCPRSCAETGGAAISIVFGCGATAGN